MTDHVVSLRETPGRKKEKLIYESTLKYFENKYKIKDKCITIFNLFNLTDAESKATKTVIDKFTDHFAQGKHLTLVRHNFFARKQKSDEPFEDYFTAIINLALQCDLGALREELTKAKIISGLYSKYDDLETRLMAEEDKTLTLSYVAKYLKTAKSWRQAITRMQKDNCTDIFLLSFAQKGPSIRDYETLHCTRGGGVIIAVQGHISANYVFSSKNAAFEDVWVRVDYNKIHLIIGNVYVPPRSQPEEYQTFIDSIELLRRKYPSAKFLIFGDFNLPEIIWFKNDSLMSPGANCSIAAQVLLENI
ncbi:hypothetical protein ILUMI_24770 [Ignelater luminosus]|uniref:Endonuclease/exonuclease/phosphatase domain-containing protein n=1 Tax=Ignelater luminosus TaxID=2038154 RepID=A0A8K0C9V3_IGNLU|nr:hypothetical protein ILUMI_24770 [Ignelater luminosus]